jgi:diacylglycerol O-acyltransferase / wax synthase
VDHLSSTDASFLHLETPETPMHIGSLMLFELPKRYAGDFYEDVKALIAKRMHLSSIFHRKLAQMPFELSDPVWIEDDDVDLEHHVRSLTLRRPGTIEQLEALVARLHSSILDRSRPLWEVYVIDGLDDGRIAYYTKAHHSGIDGKAGMELAKVMYDTSPEIREVPPPRRSRSSNPYQLGVSELLQAAAENSAKQYEKVGKLLPAAIKGLAAAAKIVAERREVKGERNLNLGKVPKTIFNASITNQRSYSTLSLPLAEVKALGKRVGGTVNTVVMAMCSGALRRFLLDRDLLPTESLVAIVPVSLRAADDKSMNNQVSMIRVDLATDIDDTAARFKAIHASSEAAKEVVSQLKPLLGADLPVTGSPWLMTGLASLLGRADLANRITPTSNVCISNVPGVPTQLYLAGARMVNFFPVSIPYHNTGLNITVQSYAGQMEFGLTACRRVVSQEESHELVKHMQTALKEIEALSTVGEASAAPLAAVKEPVDKPVKKTVTKPQNLAAAKKATPPRRRNAAATRARP